jgi:hypothetical protein
MQSRPCLFRDLVVSFFSEHTQSAASYNIEAMKGHGHKMKEMYITHLTSSMISDLYMHTKAVTIIPVSCGRSRQLKLDWYEFFY